MESKNTENLPDYRKEYSSLTVIIMLIYVMTTFITRNIITIPIHIGNFSVVINWKMIDLIAPIAGIIAAIGIYQQVDLRSEKLTIEKIIHTIIPFALALSLGVILRNFAFGVGWIGILFFGGLALYFVFVAESILCDPHDGRIPFVRILISGLAYATFLMIMIGTRANVSRLVIAAPLIFFTSWILSARILKLDDSVQFPWIKAFLIALLTTEFAAALHYWPITILSFSVVMFGGYYTLANTAIHLSRVSSIRLILKNQIWVVFFCLVLFLYFEFTS